jgi:hypothetical protein
MVSRCIKTEMLIWSTKQGQVWSRYSIALHFALALLGVSAVLDNDAVNENRIRELKAEAAGEDIVTIRRAAVSDNPFLLLAAKARQSFARRSETGDRPRARSSARKCKLNLPNTERWAFRFVFCLTRISCLSIESEYPEH